MQSKSIERFTRKHGPFHNVLVCDSAHEEIYGNIFQKNYPDRFGIWTPTNSKKYG